MGAFTNRTWIVVLLAALALLPACQSSSSSGGDDTDTGADSDSDSDTDTGDSESDSDTGTDTDTEQVGWHWEDLEALDFSCCQLRRVTGISSENVVATGALWITSVDPDPGAVSYDGSQWHLEYTSGYDNLSGLCVTGCGTYYAAGDWSPQPGVLRREGWAWSEIDMSDWWQPDTSQPTYTALEETSLYCSGLDEITVLVDVIPGNTFYLASNDGVGWTTLAWPGAEEKWWAYFPPLVVVGSTGDLHIYGTWDYPMLMEGKLFDGESFSPLPVPETHGGFFDVEGDTEHGWWAVGYRQPPDPGTENQIGAVWFSPDLWSWEEVEVPHYPDPETYAEWFHGVWVSSKGDVFVVGAFQFTPAYDVNPVLLRFDGSEWEQIEVPPHPESDDGEAELWDVWGAESEVFAVGSYYKWGGCHPAILHFGPE